MFFGTNKTEGSLLVDESIVTTAVTLLLASGIASLEAVLIDDAAAVSIVTVYEAGAEIGVIIPTDGTPLSSSRWSIKPNCPL